MVLTIFIGIIRHISAAALHTPMAIVSVAQKIAVHRVVAKSVLAALQPPSTLFSAWMTSVGSVSYTHLDVYKRQEYRQLSQVCAAFGSF